MPSVVLITGTHPDILKLDAGNMCNLHSLIYLSSRLLEVETPSRILKRGEDDLGGLPGTATLFSDYFTIPPASPLRTFYQMSIAERKNGRKA